MGDPTSPEGSASSPSSSSITIILEEPSCSRVKVTLSPFDTINTVRSMIERDQCIFLFGKALLVDESTTLDEYGVRDHDTLLVCNTGPVHITVSRYCGGNKSMEFESTAMVSSLKDSLVSWCGSFPMHQNLEYYGVSLDDNRRLAEYGILKIHEEADSPLYHIILHKTCPVNIFGHGDIYTYFIDRSKSKSIHFQQTVPSDRYQNINDVTLKEAKKKLFYDSSDKMRLVVEVLKYRAFSIQVEAKESVSSVKKRLCQKLYTCEKECILVSGKSQLVYGKQQRLVELVDDGRRSSLEDYGIVDKDHLLLCTPIQRIAVNLQPPILEAEIAACLGVAFPSTATARDLKREIQAMVGIPIDYLTLSLLDHYEGDDRPLLINDDDRPLILYTGGVSRFWLHIFYPGINYYFNFIPWI